MKFAVLAAFLVLGFASPSFAQNAETPTPAPTGAIPNTEKEVAPALPDSIVDMTAPPPTVRTKPKAISEKPKKIDVSRIVFAPTSFYTLSKLAWAMNAYELDDNEALDQFLKITECNLYHKFFKNEFEWQKIRATTRSYLVNYGADLPRYYEFMQPIYLERYNFDLEGFPLMPNSKYESAYVIQITEPEIQYNSCGDKFEGDTLKFPLGGILRLRSPFSLSFIRVPNRVAKEYLTLLDRQNIFTDEGRPAYIRYRIELKKYLENVMVKNRSYYVFEGKLLQLDVFADREMILPLYSQKF